MKSLVLGLVLVLAVAGCSKSTPGEPALATASVDDVAQWIAGDQCTVVDANSTGTRKKMGVIPGATLLTSYDSYALRELPADKQRTLVFYCANEQCTASHAAAERARTAGWTKVKVLPTGIAGWVGAGKPVDQI
jgi:rhodanese-related sulfurtransferase